MPQELVPIHRFFGSVVGDVVLPGPDRIVPGPEPFSIVEFADGAFPEEFPGLLVTE